jgi:hypothetical protein
MYSGLMTAASRWSPDSYQARPGLELAYRYARIVGDKRTLSIIPSVRTDVNTKTNVWTTEAGVRAVLNVADGLDATADVGYFFEAGGHDVDKTIPTNLGPGSVRAGVGLRYAFGKKIPKRVEPAETEERVKLVKVRDTPLIRALHEGADLLDDNPEEASGQAGKDKATEIAERLEGEARTQGRFEELEKNTDFARALMYFKSGDLEKGRQSLSKVPEFEGR